MNPRRKFIKTTSMLGGALFISPRMIGENNFPEQPAIYCQQYPWFTFFRREGKEWSRDLDYSLNQFSKVGFTGFEPSFESVEQVIATRPLLAKYNLPTPSIYVNSVLHEDTKVAESTELVLAIAEEAKSLGVETLVTNPEPISWGGEDDKTDRELSIQARALNDLGARLKRLGIKLAYHNHDTEMRQSAREFHHMLRATDAEHVHLCLDAHWIYRGAGDSQIALFDIIDMYVNRVVELHLRQSRKGIWTEDFCQGDVEYPRLVKILKEHDIRPHLVMEQAVEPATENSLNAVEAHKLGLEYARSIFSG